MCESDQDRLDLVGRAFDAISCGDTDGAVACYTDDYVLEVPFAKPLPKRVEGREPVRAYLRSALRVFRFELRITAVHPTLDPEVWVLEYTSEGYVVTTGKPYANRYVGIVTFRDDLIASLREYFDPTPATVALTP